MKTKHGKRNRGFTLLELLVAGCVFAILVMLIAQAISSMDRVTGSQRRYLEAVASARTAFDRIGSDLRTLVTEGDAAVVIEVRSADLSDRISFLTLARPSADLMEAAAPEESYRLTRVTYELQEATLPGAGQVSPVLMRRQSPVYWAVDDFNLGEVLSRAPGSDDIISPVSPGVFRFEVVWIRNDGTLTRDPRGASDLPDGEAPLPTGFLKVDPAEVKGFILSLAVLDQTHLGRMDHFSELYRSLPMASLTGESDISAHLWRGALPSAKPAGAVANIRVLQRTYYLWQ